MEIYALPENIELFIWDIDNTLYRNDEYYRGQLDLLMKRYARHAGIETEEARRRISEARGRLAEKSGGRKTSMGNAMASLGVSLEENARWRSELFEPEKFLHEDRRLYESLDALAGRSRLIALTNNSSDIGIRTLRCLGVAGLFEKTIGLDSTHTSKPSHLPFKRVLVETGVAAEAAVSIGDRYDVDIEPALDLGMGGIVVESLEDVYRLPEVFGYTSKS